jgi:transposase
MRKIKEVLRLKYELGLGQRQIARSCSLGLGTVNDYLCRAEGATLRWPLPEGWDEERIEEALYGAAGVRAREPERALPDFATLRTELQKSKHVTLQLLWEEYRTANPEGYRYSRFCGLYQRWRGTQDVVLRQEYKAGEKLFVDWAGATIPIYSRTGDETTEGHLFVAVLGASSYTWAEAAADEQMVSWLTAHMRAFEFFGGVTRLVIPDNPKTGVTRACRYDPDLNPTYHEMAMHYGVGVVPARPRKPRDKAKVESGVLVVERWIIAALRNRRFFGIEELNEAIRGLLERLNQRPFRKRGGTRSSLFETLDKPALGPLPAERFDLSQWAKARVNIDYHVAFDANYYSVPYNLVHEPVEIRSLPATVEIFHKGKRVASHVRRRGEEQLATMAEHRPKSHREHLEWTPSRMVNWANSIGANTALLFERILEDKPHPEMGYRGCLGIIRLAKKYGNDRMEAAAMRALASGACRYKSIESILRNSLDLLPPEPPPDLAQPRGTPPPNHDNIRGAGYFDASSPNEGAQPC